MKKSTKIHLLLVSVALASCNRRIIPAQPASGYSADSTLTAAPACDDSPANYYTYPYFPFDLYFNWQPFLYYPVQTYRKGAFGRRHHFILRGGFGKRASAGS